MQRTSLCQSPAGSTSAGRSASREGFLRCCPVGFGTLLEGLPEPYYTPGPRKECCRGRWAAHGRRCRAEHLHRVDGADRAGRACPQGGWDRGRRTDGRPGVRRRSSPMRRVQPSRCGKGSFTARQNEPGTWNQ